VRSARSGLPPQWRRKTSSARAAPRAFGAQIEAEVHGAHDRLRVAPLRLAPPVEHRALVGPVLRTDVGPVPPSAYFAAARRVRFSPRPPIQIGMRGWSGFGLLGVDHAEVLALEGDAPALGSSSSRMICAYSSSMSSRGPMEGNGYRRPLPPRRASRRRGRSRRGRGRDGRWWSGTWRAARGYGRRRSRRRCRAGSSGCPWPPRSGSRWPRSSPCRPRAAATPGSGRRPRTSRSPARRRTSTACASRPGDRPCDRCGCRTSSRPPSGSSNFSCAPPPPNRPPRPRSRGPPPARAPPG